MKLNPRYSQRLRTVVVVLVNFCFKSAVSCLRLQSRFLFRFADDYLISASYDTTVKVTLTNRCFFFIDHELSQR